MDNVLRQKSGYGVKVSNKQLSYLHFVDDIVLLENSQQRLWQLLDAIIENLEKVSLIINVDISKSMPVISSPFVLHHKNTNLEQGKDLKYLGSWIDCDGDLMSETKLWIGKSTGALNRLKPIWRRTKYFLRLMLRPFNIYVLFILLYAS